MESRAPVDALARAEQLGYLEIDFHRDVLDAADRSPGGLPVELEFARRCEVLGRTPLFLGRLEHDHFVAAVPVRAALMDAFVGEFLRVLEQPPNIKIGPALHTLAMPRPIAVALVTALAAVDARHRGVAPATVV